MANDLFGGLGNLGGLFGGLAKSVVPQDTPEGKLLRTQSDLSDLQKQESDILLEIGRKAYAQNPSAWPQNDKLRLIQSNIAAAETELDAAKREHEDAKAAKAAEDAKGRCTECGAKNPDGIKFCQECGSRLGSPAKTFCTSCGCELASGTRFCGGCGAQQGG